ncbi:mannose-6-phosphate isomerase, class I [Endozoicomonas euniceicola]|uniref:mannose-6-phosphate isomerase n=1 Tax=Endozoicomonas euniceicola TaxID=1234143 RepID=A0ABY6H0E0_9GAMM|nr:mannose-6-phosphate isomerase, class I [Endozoicomonas euniceicola]UYM18505.1 mannose-6-phosphate isomerase, class I [Endozoicomonas euniceicola]
MIYKLENTIQDYVWGCPESMLKLFNIENSEKKPMAELWMGAHPKAPSSLIGHQKYQSLLDYISIDVEVLGEASQNTFGSGLPFLFKVLSADLPLSIQAHPDKAQAEAGFKRENALGLPLNAANRNYRDPNHKPELVYALTPFKAMNGFRQVKEIVSLFRMANISALTEALDKLDNSPNESGLKLFYQTIMTLKGQQKENLIKEAFEYSKQSDVEAWKEVCCLHEYYPGDIGVLSPLLLNLVTLSPGDAMFLKAGTLHAYLKGTALEIMACSDNVLRGGLTKKHVDIEELLKTIDFGSTSEDQLLLEPTNTNNGELLFKAPVNDFCMSIITPEESPEPFCINSAEILFSIKGSQEIICDNGEQLILHKGESCFISAKSKQFSVTGSGQLARANSIIH